MIFRVIYPVLLIGQCLRGQDLRAIPVLAIIYEPGKFEQETYLF